MNFPDDIQTLGAAVQSYLMKNGSGLSKKLGADLIAALGAPSPVDRIVQAGECLYAARDELSGEGKELCAQLISFATMNGWHGLSEENRGGRIVMAMRRDLGEKAPSGSWPKGDTDPEADARFAVSVEAEPAVPVDSRVPLV
jgi:hypothetical protein